MTGPSRSVTWPAAWPDFARVAASAPAPALLIDAADQVLLENNAAHALRLPGEGDAWRLSRDEPEVHAALGERVFSCEVIADADSAQALCWIGQQLHGDATQPGPLSTADMALRLDLVAEFVDVGFWERDLTTRAGAWDAQCFRMYGFDPTDGVPAQTGLFAFMHPDDRDAVAAAWEETYRIGSPGSVQFRMMRSGETLRALQARWRVVEDDQGGRKAVGLLQDITPSYAAAQRVSELNNRLGLAASVGGIGLWVWELDRDRVFWDDRLHEIQGVKLQPEGVTMDFMRRAVLEEDRPTLEAATERVLREPGEAQSEYRIRRPDGEVRYLMSRRTAQRNEFGVPVRVVAVVVDITETRRRDAQIAELASRLRLATEAGRIGVWDWDLLAGVVVYSEQYRELLGYDEHEWPNRSDTWANHLHPDDWENARNAIDDYIAGRAPIYSTEHRLLCKDGSWKWFVDRGAVVENDAEGNPLRMVGTLIDLTERKQAEIALREAQTRMELATAAAGLGIFEFDVSSRLFSFDAQTAVNYVLANGARTMTFGEWMSIVHADDANRVRRELVWMRENGVSGRIEFRIRRRDGEVRWILADYLVRRDARGEMLSVLGTNLDTTDRRRAEAVAREASERLAIATQAAGIGVWECDADLNEPIWNDQMYTLFGYLPDALVTPLRVFNEAVRIDHGNEVRRRLFECARKGVPYEYEFQITRGDGMVRWIAARGTLRRDAEGRPLSILGANWDVTESRSARAALEEITARMRLATAATGIGIWSHDRNTGEMYWDDQLYRLFGRDAADGQTPDQVWAEAVPRADQKRVRVNQTHAVNKRVPYSHEFTVIWPDGSERRIAARGSVLDGPDGSLRMIGVNWDVTEQRRAEQTLLAKDAAEQASRAKSEFLSRMSHELRTPLNAILGFAQLLLLDATEALSGEQRNRLDRIQVAGWHLLELINEVLDLTRIEAGAVKLGNEPIVVGDLVSECMDLILPQAQNAGLALATDTARADGMIVVADRTRLKQVLLNLLSNAIKYNFAGGSITVGVARGADSTVDIYVKDTGRGMTEVQLSRLYEPFDRLGVDTTGIEGTGIGLAISRRLVELMKGSIDVTSEAGVGSEFRVKLPRAPANAIPRIRNTDTSPQVPAVPETEFKATVLYIEDNPLNRLLIEQYLMLRPAWTLVHAEDGSSGVALARVLQPDLTLVDINLPDLDGFEVVRRLQSDPLTHGLKFIALSANAMPQDIERASDAGFEDYWTKPIAVEDFLTRLDAWSAERLGRAR